MTLGDIYNRLTTARNNIRTALKGKGINADSHGFESFAADITNIVTGGGGGLPAGLSKVAYGTITPSSDITTTRQTITHNLGVVPDMVVVWYEGSNIAQTYTMLWCMRATNMGFRSSAYTLYAFYHGNSTTTVSGACGNSTTAGVSNLTATTFQLASYSSSYYWRAGYTYKWMAIKY